MQRGHLELRRKAKIDYEFCYNSDMSLLFIIGALLIAAASTLGLSAALLRIYIGKF
jgi:hypothetical protein